MIVELLGQPWHYRMGNFRMVISATSYNSHLNQRGIQNQVLRWKYFHHFSEYWYCLKQITKRICKLVTLQTFLDFYKDIVTATSCGTKLPDITTSVDNIFIHTNIIVIVLFLVLVPIFCIVNLSIIYLRVFHCILSLRASYDKINSNIIKEMHIHLTDALDRPLYFNNIPISLILILKEEWNM